ncbi:hypothetical protein TNCV_3160401 [Trichonephila clavipes]|nr:hypothetical protein TNCV_3160401 [Trichonephila clavipes]
MLQLMYICDIQESEALEVSETRRDKSCGSNNEATALLARQRRKRFLHLIGTGDEKWARYDTIPSAENPGISRPCFHVDGQTEYSRFQVMLSIWWLGVVYYESCQNRLKTITGDR